MEQSTDFKGIHLNSLLPPALHPQYVKFIQGNYLKNFTDKYHTIAAKHNRLDAKLKIFDLFPGPSYGWYFLRDILKMTRLNDQYFDLLQTLLEKWDKSYMEWMTKRTEDILSGIQFALKSMERNEDIPITVNRPAFAKDGLYADVGGGSLYLDMEDLEIYYKLKLDILKVRSNSLM